MLKEMRKSLKFDFEASLFYNQKINNMNFKKVEKFTYKI